MAAFKANMKFILSQKTVKWAQRMLIGEWKADTEIMDSHPERITPCLNKITEEEFPYAYGKNAKPLQKLFDIDCV